MSDINEYAKRYLENDREQYRELSFLYHCMLKEQAEVHVCEELKDFPDIYGVLLKKEDKRRIYYAFLTTPGKI